MTRGGGPGRMAARCVVLDAERALVPGEIAWDERGRVVSLRRARGAVEDVCLLPGLVDAHSHVQIAPLDEGERRFVPWLRAVMAARTGDSPSAERERTLARAHELLREGVTALGDIDATGRGLDTLARTPLRGRVYRELTGFHLDAAAARALVRERRRGSVGALQGGLSPHAPYSVSAALFAAARRAHTSLAIHCAETPEEQRFLREGRGPFADLLAELGRLPRGFRAPGTGAVRWLERLGVLAPTTALVHCQELERGDDARIAEAGASVVVCPGTIEWFGRTPPPVPKWLARGIAVALGTDSPASTRRFSLRGELSTAARWWPQLRPEQVFAMATSAGGRALGLPGAGRLRRGGRADFLVVRGVSDPTRVVADFVAGGGEVVAVHVAGRRVGRHGLRR